jgi:hypothetical protein
MAFLFGRDVGRDALRGGRREREEEFEKVEMVEGEGRLKRKKKKKMRGGGAAGRLCGAVLGGATQQTKKMDGVRRRRRWAGGRGWTGRWRVDATRPKTAKDHKREGQEGVGLFKAYMIGEDLLYRLHARVQDNHAFVLRPKKTKKRGITSAEAAWGAGRV